MTTWDWANLLLYLLAITLAVHALIQAFPERTKAKFSLTGALATLFLTFFLTSLRIDMLERSIADADIHRSASDRTIPLLGNVIRILSDTSIPGTVLSELIEKKIQKYSTLQSNPTSPMNVTEAEGTEIITDLIQALVSGKVQGVKVVAASTDPRVFNSLPLEDSECDIATYSLAKCSPVRRSYVVKAGDWPDSSSIASRVAAMASGSMSQSSPWAYIAPTFNRADASGKEALAIVSLVSAKPYYSAILNHWLNGVDVALVRDEYFGGTNSEQDYDAIIITRGNAPLCAAHRLGDGRMEVSLGFAPEFAVWSNRVNSLWGSNEARHVPIYKGGRVGPKSQDTE